MKRLVSRALAALCILSASWPASAQVDSVARGIATKALTQNAPPNSIPGVFGLTPASLPHYRAALARMRAGTANANVAIVGDSTSVGFGGGTGSNNMTGAKAAAYVARLATILNGMGYPAETDSVFGTGIVPGYGPTYNDYNPAVSSGNWVPSVASVSGALWVSTDNTSFTLAANAVDSVDFYYSTDPNLGTGTITVGGTTIATVTQTNATSGFGKITATTTKGNVTFSLQHTSGNAIFLIGLHAYDSTTPKIALWNMGAIGWASTDYAQPSNPGGPWVPILALPFIAPDLCFINLGINDWNKATPISQPAFSANIQALITACQVHGDVILVAPFPSQNTAAPIASQAAFISTLYTLAANDNLPLVDLTFRFGSWAQANAEGFTYDSLHPDNLGYADIAQILSQVLTR